MQWRVLSPVLVVFACAIAACNPVARAEFQVPTPTPANTPTPNPAPEPSATPSPVSSPTVLLRPTFVPPPTLTPLPADFTPAPTATNTPLPGHSPVLTPVLPALPAGSVVNSEVACPPGSTQDSRCIEVEVACPGIDPARAVLRINPGGSTAPAGTMLFTTDHEGLEFERNTSPFAGSMLSALSGLGVTTVEVSWSAPGIWGGPNARTLACRYATVARWVHANVHEGGSRALFAVQGTGGGASQIAFGLAYYGLEDIIGLANIASGPSICPLCGVDPGPSEPLLRASQVAGEREPRLLYPGTVLRFFLGAREPDSAVVTDARAYYSAVSSRKSLQTVPDAGHLISSSANGANAMVARVSEALRALRGG